MKKITLLFIFFISQSIYSQISNGFLRRQNTQFVNNNGVVLLKGINLGNWLHIEPYMINAPSNIAGSYESLHSAISNVTGSSANADSFFSNWYNTFIQKKDIDSIASMGFNHVRVPFPYHMFYDDDSNTFINDGFVYLDRVVQWCKQNNIYAILDLHHAMGGQINTGIWSSYNTSKPILMQIWKNIATHYTNETAIGGYDILNEPVISAQSEQWKLKDLYVAITNEIRTVDRNHILFFEGNWYASSFWELTDGSPSSNDRWDDNMAFSQHVYWVPQPSQTNYWTTFIANAMDIPVWCGEGGENSNHWLNDWVRDCVSVGSSWCLWTYKKAGGVSSIYTQPYNLDYQLVLNYWNGGSLPSVSQAINGLNLFAQQSDLNFCFFRKDVLDAVLRDNYHTTPIPFSINTIPGTVLASNYDMGANGIASSDLVFQSTGQGSNFTNYNNGWTYRNDGVDLETWTGSTTVGSISDGEWLNYTLNVVESGMYRISIEMASPSNERKFKVESNNLNIIDEKTFNGTPGWGSFQYRILDTIPIVAQQDFPFKLISINGGVNLRTLRFEKISDLSCDFIPNWSGKTKTWINNHWEPSSPSLVDQVILQENYSTGSFSCYSLNFNGNNVILSNGQSLEIVRGVSGTGKVIMSSESSLVQRDPLATKPQIELTKTTRPIKRYDYVYWGTPIVENAFSQLDNAVADGQTTAGAFDFKYRYVSGDLTATGGWQTLSSTAPGQGFIMRVKQQAPFLDATTAENINLNFVGTANNGDITVPIAYASANPASVRNNSLLANPYPSAIYADKFLDANTGLLDGAIYLWRANTTNVTGSSNYVVADYIAYTKAGSTAYAGTTASGADFDGFIASGQGFKVRALQSGTAQFNNCMRVLTNNNQFFRSAFDANDNVVKDRYKVNIRNSEGFANQILVAYLPETSLNYDYKYDAELLTVSQTNLYSVLESTGAKLAINSRCTFNAQDQVTLGYVHNTSSNLQLTIDVEQREGIFNNNLTTIYLFDSLLNVYHDFANGSYSFTAISAQDNTRFKLVYENSTLGSDDFNSNMAYAMLNDNNLQINASLPIKNVQVFDITGRLIMNETLADSNTLFRAPFNKPQAVYIVKISLDNGKIVTVKFVNTN